MKKAIYKGKVVEVDYMHKNDNYACIEGERVDKKELTVIPIEWTTYALIAVGGYLVGLITVMIWNS